MREHDTVTRPHLAHQILPAYILYSARGETVSARHLQLAVQQVIGDLKIMRVRVMGYLGEVSVLEGEASGRG